MHPIIESLLKKIQPCFLRKAEHPAAPAPKPLHERSFNRFSIETEVLVTTVAENGNPYSERLELRDISGSGAMFITGVPEKYFTGQRLKLDIFLAGTQAVKACVKTEAEVVRIQSLPSNNSKGPAEWNGNCKTGVAVKFYLPFEFQRIDSRLDGNDP